MRTLKVSVPAMTCRHCVRSVTARLRDVPGVRLVVADAGRAVVELRGTVVDADVLNALEDCGFPGVVLG